VLSSHPRLDNNHERVRGQRRVIHTDPNIARLLVSADVLNRGPRKFRPALNCRQEIFFKRVALGGGLGKRRGNFLLAANLQGQPIDLVLEGLEERGEQLLQRANEGAFFCPDSLDGLSQDLLHRILPLRVEQAGNGGKGLSQCGVGAARINLAIQQRLHALEPVMDDLVGGRHESRNRGQDLTVARADLLEQLLLNFHRDLLHFHGDHAQLRVELLADEIEVTHERGAFQAEDAHLGGAHERLGPLRFLDFLQEAGDLAAGDHKVFHENLLGRDMDFVHSELLGRNGSRRSTARNRSEHLV
jgi:hypothetical protein